MVPELAGLPVLREASAARATVEFEYRGTARRLDPYGLLLRGGFWYVVGHDHSHDEQRTYRVDRISGDVTAGAADAFERPAGFDLRAAFPVDPKLLGADGGEDAVARGPRRRGARRRRRARARCRAGDGAPRRRVDRGEVPCANVAGVPVVGARPARPRRGARTARRAPAIVVDGCSSWRARRDGAGSADGGGAPRAPARDAAVADGAGRGAARRGRRPLRADARRRSPPTSSWPRCAGCRRSSTR